MVEVHADHTDDGKTLGLHVGDTLVVTLPVNMTTGYRWTVSSLDDSRLTLAEETITAPPTGQAVGAGGSTAVFRFLTEAPGASHLAIKLWRGYEADEDVVHYRLALNIATR
ncbi:protease inhibitor I42 family protein [Streptomyces lydicus]